MTPFDLRWGNYTAVLHDVECDAVICDPPFSETTHDGHDAGTDTANRRTKANGVRDTGRARREITYDHWTPADVFEFVQFWRPRCRGWFVACTDSELWPAWRAALRWHELVTFQPVILNIPGMSVRQTGDGPSSWCIPVAVARPKGEPWLTWGTLPGSYTGTVGSTARAASSVAGSKPLWAMRALVRDYSRPGDLVVDPCAGGGTTLAAALLEGRRAIGSEIDEDTYRVALNRLSGGFTPDEHNLSLFPEAGR